MARLCIFCGNRADSREHVIPDWLAEFLIRPGQTMTVTRGRERVRNSFDEGISFEQTSRWETDLLVIRVRQVCARCNSTWMSNLEGAAQPYLKPMIRGLRTELPPEAQDIIARWVFKTVVMFQYAQTPPYPADPDRLKRIFTGATPPKDDWVALAQYAGDDVAIWAHHRSSSAIKPSPLMQDVKSETLTLCIGHLVIQTVVWTRGRNIRLLIPTDAYDFIVPVWPSGPLVRTWPPAASLDGRSFFVFCDNFTSGSSLRIFVPDDTAV